MFKVILFWIISMSSIYLLDIHKNDLKEDEFKKLKLAIEQYKKDKECSVKNYNIDNMKPIVICRNEISRLDKSGKLIFNIPIEKIKEVQINSKFELGRGFIEPAKGYYKELWIVTYNDNFQVKELYTEEINEMSNDFEKFGYKIKENKL